MSIKTPDDWWNLLNARWSDLLRTAAICGALLDGPAESAFVTTVAKAKPGEPALRDALERARVTRDWETVHGFLERCWAAAPDSPEIHTWPAWADLCDLCSEAGVFESAEDPPDAVACGAAGCTRKTSPAHEDYAAWLHDATDPRCPDHIALPFGEDPVPTAVPRQDYKVGNVVDLEGRRFRVASVVHDEAVLEEIFVDDLPSAAATAPAERRIILDGEELVLTISGYADGRGRAALYLTCANGEPYGTVTTNVDDKLAPDEVVLKNYDSGPKFLRALCEAGVLEDTGRTVRLGYARGHVCRLLWKGEASA